jgi:serine/threonine protein kinase
MSTIPIGRRPRHVRRPETDGDEIDENADRGTLAAGTRLGSYRIEHLIAEGGMGSVYEAVHVILPRRAAIKVLHKYLLGKWSARERLFQEARILEAFCHPGLVKIFDAGILDDERPWLAMEYLEGLTVAHRIELHGKLDPLEVIDILGHTASALEAAHQAGVIHRDLKPENIMLVRAAGGTAVRVIDWGIARVHGEPTGKLTRANMTPGTPLYMSPEQARGKAVDGRSDIYTLGVIATEALTGVPPFEGESPLDVVVQHLTAEPPSLRSRRADLPEALDQLILAMLAKEPSDRPSLPAIRERLDAIGCALRADYEDVSIEMELDVDGDTDELIDSLEAIDAPLLGRPRWTPQSQPIVPGEGSDVVAGEITARPSRRRQAGSAETLGLVVTTLLTGIMLAVALMLPAFELGRGDVRSLAATASHTSALDRHTERHDHVNIAGAPSNVATSHAVDVAHHLQ